jgi:hypothetical protein
VDGHTVDDAYLLAWLEDTRLPDNITLRLPDQGTIPLQRLTTAPSAQFGFNSTPRAPA